MASLPWETWLPVLIAAALLLLTARRLAARLLRLLLRSGLWLGLLALLSGSGLPLLGVNCCNALLLGLLGLPGLGLLLFLRWTGT